VVGVASQRPVAAMKKVYEPFNAPIIVTDINSAELIKHASNSFLALKISYANALSAICEASGANILEVANGMGMDKRIGRSFLDAGLGYGGSCFPKDLSAFIHIAQQLGYDFRLLKEVQHINADQMERFLKKIRATLWVLKEKTIAVLGLTFKPNTDDVRNSLPMDLVVKLKQEGARIRAYDPKGMEKAKEILPDITYCKNALEACSGSDAVIIATEWAEFKNVDLGGIRDSMTHPIMFDGRNVFEPAEMEKLGFVYKSVGR
jgi:UDPglucose 6-dehydrogenase